MSDDFKSWGEIDGLLGKLAAYRSWLVETNRAVLLKEPSLAEALNQKVREMYDLVEQAEAAKTPPVDGGLLNLIGLGANANSNLGNAATRRRCRPMTTRSRANASRPWPTSTTSTSSNGPGSSAPS